MCFAVIYWIFPFLNRNEDFETIKGDVEQAETIYIIGDSTKPARYMDEDIVTLVTKKNKE